MNGRCHGAGAFWLWALAGGLLLFTILTGASIGLFVLPAALLALALAARWASPWPEALGLVSGLGLPCLAIGVLWARADHGGGAPGWLAAGATLTLGGVAAYLAAARP
ncbi:MAG: hypothetical protein IT201_07400 [Thermoleophilia bacterium]|nr:hypothetical protein [Thermoleophilia bacterium]